MMRIWFLLLPLLCIAGPVRARTLPRGQYARTARCRIFVSEKQSRDPLIGAAVTIASGSDTLRGVASKTDAFYTVRAVYECDRIFRDSVDLEVSCLGFHTFRKRYAPAEFSGYIDILLDTDEQDIAQVVVLGRQVAMVYRGDTTIYNAAAFKTLADDRLAELLKQMPGIEIRDNRIYADGEEIRRVYVDGRNLFGRQTSASLTDLEAGDVRQVRVYEEASPEAERTGDNTARKEKVMDVETKSGRSVLKGGKISATAGASIEKDYSGSREIRSSESGEYHRHSERGSTRIDAAGQKDIGRQDNVSPGSKITPYEQFSASLSHEMRRGDSTSVWTTAHLSGRRGNTLTTTVEEYFPTDEYTLRSEESRTDASSRSLLVETSSFAVFQRRGNVFNASLGLSFRNSSSDDLTRTSQTVDSDRTRTDLHTVSDSRDLTLNASLSYSVRLSERSRLSLDTSFDLSGTGGEGSRTDTLAVPSGLRTQLGSTTAGRNSGFAAGAAYRYKSGEHTAITAGYRFAYRHARNEQTATDYLAAPQGATDTVNTYDYSTGCRTHTLSCSWSCRHDGLNCSIDLQASLYDLSRDDRFPEPEHTPHRFLGLAPSCYLSLSRNKRRLSVNLRLAPQVPSTESLRSTLDATNPLLLQTGNPDLKMPAEFSGSIGFSATRPETSRTVSAGIRGGYGFNRIASRRTLFLTDTYLPQYDYTARKGAQLTTQANAGGSWSAGGVLRLSKQLAALRSTLELALDYDFDRRPYFLDEERCTSGNHSLRFLTGLESGFSEKIRISLQSVTALTAYSTRQETARDLRETVLFRTNLRFGKYFGYAGCCYEFYCNSRSALLTRHNIVCNAAAGRKFGRENRFSASVGIFDIFNRPDYASTRFDTDVIRTNITSYLGRYAYAELSYTF